MTRTMYDSTNVGDIPSHATMIAVYADGPESGTYEAAKKRFPHAKLVTITVNGEPNRNVADVERYDLTPSEGVKWAKDEIAAGRKPTLYTSEGVWDALKDLVRAAGIEGKVSYWIAAYPGIGEHVYAGSVAHQWEGSPGNSPGHYDVSVVADYWPGVDPVPSLKKTALSVLTRHDVKQATRRLKRRHNPTTPADVKLFDALEAQINRVKGL